MGSAQMIGEPWRRLGRNRILDVAAVAVAMSAVFLWSTRVPPRWSEADFNHYYIGSRLLLEGQNPYTTSSKPMSATLGFQFSEALPVYTYPPGFLRLFEPLAAFPPRVAFAIWVSAEIGCLMLILWLTHRLLGEKLSARGWLFIAALTVMSRTVSYNLYYSQAQLMLAALILAAYAAHRAGRHGWACLVVSAAGLLKVYPFVLLPWFVWTGAGRLRTRVYRVLGVTAFILAIVALTGPGLWRDFFRYGVPLGREWEEAGRNFHYSLAALVSNLGYLHHDFGPSLEARHWWWYMGAMAGLAVMAMAYGVCLATRRDEEMQFSLLCVAMLIGTVTVQGHYFVFLVFPLTVAAIRIAAKPTPVHVAGLILLVLAVNCVDPPDSPFLWQHPVLYLLVGDVPLYGLLGLGAFFGYELWGHRKLSLNPAYGQG
jgi:hypothetical protein